MIGIVPLAALLLAAVPGAAAGQTREARGIELGAKPEPVQIEDLDGRPVDLGEYFEKGPVLLEFWATWCGNCLALHPRMLEAHRLYGDRVQFLAIGVGVGQTPATIRRVLAQRPVPFPTLWDGRGEAARAFMAPATSYIVILDADGKVAYTGLGSDQDVVAAVRGVL